MLLALRLLITPKVSSNFSDAVCQEQCASCPWSDTINKKCRLQNFLLNVSFGTFLCFVVTHMLLAFASQSHHLCFMGTSVTVMAWYVFFYLHGRLSLVLFTNTIYVRFMHANTDLFPFIFHIVFVAGCWYPCNLCIHFGICHKQKWGVNLFDL